MNTNKHSKKVVHLPLFIQKNHKAILFSLLLFLMLPTTFVHAQRLYTTDGVNVRAKPNGSSKILTSVSAGTPVTRTGSKGNWIAVKVDGVRGYIYKTYLKRSKKASASSANSTSYRAVITASSVNMRAKPSFSGRIKGSLSAGQSVTVCTTKGAWKKVKTSAGKKGYVYGIYVGKRYTPAKKAAKTSPTASTGNYRSRAISYAHTRLGNKYSQARRDQKGYADCSSLVRDAYKSATDKYIGNTTYEQLELMHSYLYSVSSVHNVTVGDLVFHRGGSNHVGIYLGNGKVLHASQTAGKVKISTFSRSSTYWDTGCNAAAYCASR